MKNSYLKKINLPPSSATFNTFSKPPVSLSPKHITHTIPPIIIIN